MWGTPLHFNAEAAHLPMATSAHQTEFYTLAWVYTCTATKLLILLTLISYTFGVALMILENYGSNMASLLMVEIHLNGPMVRN